MEGLTTGAIPTGGAKLILDDLRRAIETIRTAPPRTCGVTVPHVVHPADLGRGWTICANCMQAVESR